ncbi:hypothetical protein TRVL_04084 [Trypanosoma vivax]|nr:hypothetical protein TRVL_04084 [Trypanosoma vivax]
MTISPLALLWVRAHLNRRGLRCDLKDERKPPGTRVGTGSSGVRATVRADGTPWPHAEAVYSHDDLLLAIGHRFIAQSAGKSAAAMTDKKSAKKTHNNPSDYLAGSGRLAPHLAAATVAKLVDSHSWGPASSKGSMQALLLIHHVATPCVQFALRYSSVQIPPNTTDKGLSASNAVLPSQHIPFSWSSTEAAGHLAIVFKSGAVQRRLRSRLWKLVDRDHKKILSSALGLVGSVDWGVLASTEAGGDAGVVHVSEADVKLLFSVPADMVQLASQAIKSLAPSTEPQCTTHQMLSGDPDGGAPGNGVNGQYPRATRSDHVDLCSDSQFAYEASSKWLVDTLTRNRYEMIHRVLLDAGDESAGCHDVPPLVAFMRQFTALLVEMSRVRMAVSVLLQFEVLARRYMLLDKYEGDRQRYQTLAAAAARDLCALALSGGSRALETPQLRKRFAAKFSLVLYEGALIMDSTRDSSEDDGAGAVTKAACNNTPYCSLKAVFAALSTATAVSRPRDVASRHIERQAIDSLTTRPSSSKCTADDIDNVYFLPPTDADASVDDDPLLRVVMKTEPGTVPSDCKTLMKRDKIGAPKKALESGSRSSERSGHHRKSTKKSRDRAGKKQPGKRSEGARGNLQGVGPASWNFRCCQSVAGCPVEPINVVPCSVEDTKIVLLRSSLNVPWPFRLEPYPVSCGDSDAACQRSDIDSLEARRAQVKTCMRFDTTWARSTTGTVAGSMGCVAKMTVRDVEHAAQLERVLSHNRGELLLLNGCPTEKFRSLVRIARSTVRLIVRFRT